MTVIELIEALKAFPPETLVAVPDSNWEACELEPPKLHEILKWEAGRSERLRPPVVLLEPGEINYEETYKIIEGPDGRALVVDI